MAVKKAKAAISIPKSYEAANALLQELGEVSRELVKAETDLAEEVAVIIAKVELNVAPKKLRLKQITEQLQAYADQERATLTNKGAVKFHAMPAGRIGWRANPTSVKWAKGLNGDHIVEAVKALCAELRRRRKFKLLHVAETFIRIKEEPNKETMLSAQKLAKLVDGVRIGSTGETFYAEPNDATLSGAAP